VDTHLIKRSIGTINFSAPFHFRKGNRSQVRTKAVGVKAALAGFYPDADGGAGPQAAGGFEFKAIRAAINQLGIDAILLVENGESDGALVETTFR
jgi:hypothetical protein